MQLEDQVREELARLIKTEFAADTPPPATSGVSIAGQQHVIYVVQGNLVQQAPLSPPSAQTTKNCITAAYAAWPLLALGLLAALGLATRNALCLAQAQAALQEMRAVATLALVAAPPSEAGTSANDPS